MYSKLIFVPSLSISYNPVLDPDQSVVVVAVIVAVPVAVVVVVRRETHKYLKIR